MKIPISYFLRSPGKYYLYGADVFIMHAIIELFGKNHTYYTPELVYYYKMFPNKCSGKLNIVGEKLSRMKPPFLPLKNLNDSAKTK